MPRPTALLLALRRDLAALGDPVRARGAQAYMKSAMPFHGVGAVPFRAACRARFADLELPDAAAFRREVLGLFRGARFREEMYAAVELAELKRAAPFRDLAFLTVCEEMVVKGAWWDVVDSIASHLLGELLRKEPRAMRREMLAWARCDDLWKRRSAILCQLGFKAGTDLELLYACIEPSIGSKEFFLRKAIGWALRQHAWTDAAEVVRYVAEKGERLSPLSRREALKNVAAGRPSRRMARSEAARTRPRGREAVGK